MATTYPTSTRHEFVKVTSDPGVDVSSNPVSMSKKRTRAVWFSFTGGGVATVFIQFSNPDDPDTWTDYDTDLDLTNGKVYIMDDSAYGRKWRVTMKNGGYTSGTIIVGFNW